MDIYLVRHALAAPKDSAKWPDDRDRPLTGEGEARFRKAAGGLARTIKHLDLVFSSPLARAWRTAEILHEEAGWPPPRKMVELEPGRRPEQVVEALGRHGETPAVALVGHEPHLSELTSYLMTGDAGAVGLQIRKGGAVHLSLDGAPQAGRATLGWLVPPRILRAL